MKYELLSTKTNVKNYNYIRNNDCIEKYGKIKVMLKIGYLYSTSCFVLVPIWKILNSESYMKKVFMNSFLQYSEAIMVLDVCWLVKLLSYMVLGIDTTKGLTTL